MDEEGALDAHFLRYTADGEALARPATSSAKDDALENLRPLPVAFLYLDRDPDGVSGTKVVLLRGWPRQARGDGLPL